MSFNQPVRPAFSFRGFRRRGENNPDGWGLAYYPDKSAEVFKESLASQSSALSKFLLQYTGLQSETIIAHVRKGSKGGRSHENTHPFARVFQGREYIFAHNGTLRDYLSLGLGSFKPIGETDSEYVFCYLLGSFEQRGLRDWTETEFEWLGAKLSQVNAFGTFNTLFSDGTHLFCYRDRDGYNGLCYCHRQSPFGNIRLKDEDFDINLDEEKNPTQTGYIVATKALTNERWQDVPWGCLLVFREGRQVFPSTDSPSFSSTETEVLRLLRASRHELSLKQIAEAIGGLTEARRVVALLLRQSYITQDSHDEVKWDDSRATFYTCQSRRDEIDHLIGF